MATVNKDFRVKHGLVVEGTTGTINGEDIITTAFDTDSLAEGTTNKYFTDARAKDAAAALLTGATKSNITITGNGTALTITAENGVADSDTDDLVEGVSNLYYTDARVKSVIDSAITNGTQTNITVTYDDATNALSFSAATTLADSTTDELDEGIVNLYFTDSRAVSAVAAKLGTGIVFSDEGTGNVFHIDENVVATRTYADGVAQTAQDNAETYADTVAGNAYSDAVNLVNGLTTDDIEEGITNLYFTNSRALSATASAYDAAGSATTAENNAKSYADGLAVNYDAAGAASQALADANDYTDTAVAGLVDSAPDLLNTLNELAAAIGDDANFVTTITTGLSEKVAKAGDTMTGELVLSGDPTNVLGAAPKQYVDQAEADAVATANDYTDTAIATGDATATPQYLALNVNDIAKQVASVTACSGGGDLLYSWLKADYRSAKFIVRVSHGSHTEISEVLFTLDTSDNVAVTEYGMVSTSGTSIVNSMQPQVSGNDVLFFIDVASECTVSVFGTLIA